jgi:hypothetical protein
MLISTYLVRKLNLQIATQLLSDFHDRLILSIFEDGKLHDHI